MPTIAELVADLPARDSLTLYTLPPQEGASVGAGEFVYDTSDLFRAYEELLTETTLNIGHSSPAERVPVRVVAAIDSTDDGTFTWPCGFALQTVFTGSGWADIVTPDDTGVAFGMDLYTVTGPDPGDGDGITNLYSLLAEANITNNAAVTRLIGVQTEAGFLGADASGSADEAYSLFVVRPRRKADAVAGTATKSYGAYIQANSTDELDATEAWSLFVVGGPSFYGGQSLFDPDSAADIPVIVRGEAAQTARLIQWEASTGSPLGGVKADGTVTSNASVIAHEGLTAQVAIGPLGPASQAAIVLGSALDTVLYRSAADLWRTPDSLTVDVTLAGGTITNVAGNFAVASAGYIRLSEVSDPGAAAANSGRIFMEDNGSGKTRLMIRFPSGAAQQIAIEP